MPFSFPILRKPRTSLLQNGATSPKYGLTASLSRSNVYLHEEHTNSIIGECEIALIVGSSNDVSPGIDSGLWSGVAERGESVLDLCVMPGIRHPHGGGGGHGTAGISISRGSENVVLKKPQGKHERLFVVIYACGSAFDLAARGLTPGNCLAINSTATDLVNLTEPVAFPVVHLFNNTRVTRVLDADEIKDQ